MQRLKRSTRNGACLSASPYGLNSTELSWEKLRDNIFLRYSLMPQEIPSTCDGCGKKFSIDHIIGLVMDLHGYATKEWGALGAQDLTPSVISYKPQINSRTVQRGRTMTGVC